MSFEKLWKKYKDVIPYVIFGVLTTIVNIATYWLAAHFFSVEIMISAIVAWFTAVLFAYVTNRKWVFHSEANSIKEIYREILLFFSCRLGTGIADWLCMFVFVKIIGFDDVIIKSLANLLVIVLNYLASKFVIFKHKKEK